MTASVTLACLLLMTPPAASSVSPGPELEIVRVQRDLTRDVRIATHVPGHSLSSDPEFTIRPTVRGDRPASTGRWWAGEGIDLAVILDADTHIELRRQIGMVYDAAARLDRALPDTVRLRVLAGSEDTGWGSIQQSLREAGGWTVATVGVASAENLLAQILAEHPNPSALAVVIRADCVATSTTPLGVPFGVMFSTVDVQPSCNDALPLVEGSGGLSLQTSRSTSLTSAADQVADRVLTRYDIELPLAALQADDPITLHAPGLPAVTIDDDPSEPTSQTSDDGTPWWLVLGGVLIVGVALTSSKPATGTVRHTERNRQESAVKRG
ncbi:MAG: hypothetical protein ACRDO1_15650 [Nocardioidaceae bacterium]